MDNYASGWKTLPITALVKADWNYKTEDAAIMEKLVENFIKNKQVENIIVRPIDDQNAIYEIVNGNHRLDAMIKLGYKEVFCFDVGVVSDAHAKRIAIETNETRFPVNPVRLSEIVAELTKESGVDELLQTMPFSKDQIDGMNILSEVKGSSRIKPEKKEAVYYVICEGCGEKCYTTSDGEPLLPDNGGLATSDKKG